MTQAATEASIAKAAPQQKRARPASGWLPKSIDYEGIVRSTRGRSEDEAIDLLMARLARVWQQAYRTMTPHPTGICFVRHESFIYMFDDYDSLEASLGLPFNRRCESRLVAALGRSRPKRMVRDDYRLKKWPGRDEKRFGKKWDKGHFIAHSIGGAVDQCEFNVFIQRRDVNRGWSEAGKLYRSMEQYCFAHPGTFCFSRPLYADASSKPALLEYGVLKAGRLWVKIFENYYSRPGEACSRSSSRTS